jgi:hypothetical protein
MCVVTLESRERKIRTTANYTPPYLIICISNQLKKKGDNIKKQEAACAVCVGGERCVCGREREREEERTYLLTYLLLCVCGGV